MKKSNKLGAIITGQTSINADVDQKNIEEFLIKQIPRLEEILIKKPDLHGSEILNSHKDCDRVQDPYSLRCIPQVHGTSWDSWIHLKEKVEVELNSVTDNPVVFSNNETISLPLIKSSSLYILRPLSVRPGENALYLFSHVRIV